MKKPDIPEEYLEMYNKIISPFKVPRNKWYLMPTEPLKREFLYWYFRVSLCIEFSPGETHYKVNSEPTWTTTADLYGQSSSYGDFYTKAYEPKNLDKQRKFWNKETDDEEDDI